MLSPVPNQDPNPVGRCQVQTSNLKPSVIDRAIGFMHGNGELQYNFLSLASVDLSDGSEVSYSPGSLSILAPLPTRPGDFK